MTPQARAIIKEIAELRGLEPREILGRSRFQNVVRARVEVAKRLDERGYSSPQIGKILNRDHTTVLYYIGRGRRHIKPPRWRAPKVRHLKFIRVPKPPKPERPKAIRYAGYDHTESKMRKFDHGISERQ